MKRDITDLIVVDIHEYSILQDTIWNMICQVIDGAETDTLFLP